MRRQRLSTLLVAAIAALCLAPALAEDDGGWKDTAEFSFVLTQGNAENTALGFKNTLSREWDKSAFTLKASGVRVDTTFTTYSAEELGGNVVLTRTQFDEKTAENYLLSGRYDRKISERFFWYLGAGWDRNEFAGIENRYVGEAGVGHLWFDTEDRKFKTSYAATFTKQEDVVEVPGVDDTFAGVRLSWDYMNKLSASTTYTNELVADLNVDETSDWRGDMTNAIAVSMSERLALKLSLRWLYDAEPSFFSVPVANAVVGPPVTFVELDDLDTIFTASLVVNF